DRLMITAEWYKRVTNDLLQKDIKLPSATGCGEMKFYNSGRMENRGWEPIFNVHAIRQQDFNLYFNLNMSKNRNEVLDLPDNLQLETYTFENGGYAHRIVEGNPLGSFYGYRYLGVYQYEAETYAR